MKERYLEITFRRGKALAGYLYLGGHAKQKAARTKPWGPGLVVDYGADGRAIGVEITAPSLVTSGELNRLLEEIGESAMGEGELAPLRAA